MLDDEFWRRQRHSVMARIRKRPEPTRAARSSGTGVSAGLGRPKSGRGVAWVPALTVATAGAEHRRAAGRRFPGTWEFPR